MANSLKLPDKLNSWQIISKITDDNGNETYKVSKRDYDGTEINGILRHISTSDNEEADFIGEEADFLKTVSSCGNSFNYLDVYCESKPPKGKSDLYIVTEELTPLSEILKTKDFTEDEIIDFGMQMTSALESLEAKNIYHGNITPDNIFVDKDGNYRLGGFSDFEGHISDFSYTAPEIYKKENADFTTDIYSLGLIMYSMCSNGSLPFEKDGVDAQDALKARLDGNAVTAPEFGSEKLKSIIVIACQPQNTNRWKNAGNIKNALTSISKQKSVEDTKPTDEIIAPESTEFDGNMFEEYDYEKFEDEQTAKDFIEETPAEPSIEEQDTANDAQPPETDVPNQNADESEENNTEDTAIENKEEKQTAPEISTDNDIFDEFVIGGKLNSKKFTENKDYGSYFDDEPEVKETKKESKKQPKIVTDVDIFDEDNNSEPQEDEEIKKKKTNIILPIICGVIIAAALAFVAYCVFNGLTNSDNPKSKPTQPQTTTQQTTTTPATTVAPTTVAPTTKPEPTQSPYATVISVVGYGYDDAEWLLEDAGFEVEIGEYRYSDYYDEGYVIAQYPDENTTVEKGSVIIVDISLGLENNDDEEENNNTNTNTNNNTNNNSEKKDNTFIFSNSDSAYLSTAAVKDLSYDQLETAINEIYARRGRMFNDPEISAYFNSQEWYTPKYSPSEFDSSVKFNTYEQKNLQLLVDERKTR